MADSGKLPHALLLHGPEGVGKMTVARAFAQYLFCTCRRDGDSCGSCPACLQTAKFNNPDLHYVYPVLKKSTNPVSADFASDWEEFVERFPFMPPESWMEAIDAGNSRPMIYVSESAEILRLSSLSAYGSGYKVFIIWQPEKMNAEAANKLLKVIEEPSDDTLFILVSNNPSELLPTVRSRLQSIEFFPLRDEDIIGFLCRHGKSSAEASALVKVAGGNMNRAVALLDSDGEGAEFTRSFIAFMRAAYSRNMPELRNLADSFAGFGREKSLRFLIYIARMVRESFISNLRVEGLNAMTPDEGTFVERFGPFVNAANVEEILHETDRAREDISRTANQKIIWFDFLIEITRLIRTKGIKG